MRVNGGPAGGDAAAGRNANASMAPTTLIAHIAQLVTGATAAILLGWVLWACGRGFDFTDESLYLIWVHNPHAYAASVTQFGFVYRILDWFLGGDIVLLRRANVLLTFGLAWTAAYQLLSRMMDEPAAKDTRLVISAAFAGSSLAFFQLWMPSPGYNSLAFQALLVTLIGLLLADDTRTRASDAGWFLVVAGGWLAFMAKPTTALVLAAISFLYVVLARKLSVRGVLIGLVGGAVLLVMSAWLIDGSIQGFVQRIQSGLALAQALGAGHEIDSMLRLEPLILPEPLTEAILKAGAAAALVALLMGAPGWLLQASGTIVLLAALACAIGLAIGWVPAREFGMFHGMLALAAPLAGLGVFVARGLAGRWRILRLKKWAMVAVCAALPFAYAFGSNNNYWLVGAATGYFWLLSGVGLWGLTKSKAGSWVSLLPIAALALVVAALLLQLATNSPYRQLEALRANAQPTVLGPGMGSSLLLSEADSKYIEQFKQTSARAGFVAGMPMIDLTGRAPGVLYAGGAFNVGQPWLIGGYPGSLNFVSLALDAVPCETLASSWLLIEPESPRAIPHVVLGRYGANVLTDYAPVGEVTRQADAAHSDEARRQQLLKPSRDMEVATRACVAAKAAR
ncbi:hypothetical protein [Achromobacter insolitus]|uniref:hypothetical protein n=2 Tax=Achromobacter insolitus TaxID=217204 RepID=UPI00241C0D07|nr:hypothetical protein [Achromobacter insolitus]